MNAYSQLFTKATDFVGAVEGSVDPRTGQFTINLNVGTLTANNGFGPHVPLELSYSPMTQANLGFGVGFGFGFSTYDQRSTLMSLANGTHYKVLECESSLSLIDAKLKEVSVEKLPGHYYKVMYKDGSFELLTNPDTLSSLKVPYKIVSSNGHFVTLNWIFTNNQFRLVSIVDENNNTLVSISYPDAQNLATRIAVLPDRQALTKETDNPEGYNIYLFFGDNHHLTKVTCDAAAGLEWKIGYTNLDGLGPWGQIASSVTHPGGLYEYVNYSKSKGHRFASTRTDMEASFYPYVTDFTHVPGGGQPMGTVHYDYEVINSHNFLGYAAPGIFARNPTIDALFNCSDAKYNYHTLETHSDSAGTVTRIERTYNCFHQLIESTSVTNNCSVTKRTDYYSNPGAGFEAQLANFECPQTITLIWSRADPTTGEIVATSQAVESFEYDDYGNLLEKSASYTDVNGVTTQVGTITCEYYPADKATPYDPNTGYGCPIDPNSYNRSNNIPRFMKSQTIVPHSFSGDEESMQTRFAYGQYGMPDAVTQLLAQSDPDYATSYAVFKSEQRIYHNPGNTEELQRKVTYTYADNTAVLDGSSPPMSEFGYLLTTVDTHYPNDGLPIDPADPKTAECFSTTTTAACKLVEDTLEATSTVTTWDNFRTSISNTSSRFTGRVTEKVDAMGVKAQATYDVLGRVLSVTTAVGTNYANERQLAYEISDTGLIITACDAFGNQARVTADGAGKPVKGEAKLSGASSIWQVMETRAYDNAGRLYSTTTNDYAKSTDQAPYGSITTTNHYDVWGQVDYVTTLDGIRHFSAVDPIALTKTQYSQSGGATPITTSRTITTANATNATVTVAVFASDNATTVPDSTATQTYDGWKQLRESTDELGRTTTYTYDNFGRVVTTALPTVTVGDRLLITPDNTPADGISAQGAVVTLTGENVSSQTITVKITDIIDDDVQVSFIPTSGVTVNNDCSVTTSTDMSGVTPIIYFVSQGASKVTLTASTPSVATPASYDFTSINPFQGMAKEKQSITEYIGAGDPLRADVIDATVVTRTYSRDTASNVVVDILVNDISMGTREVDGMGRITHQTVGGRSWSASYDKDCGSLTSPATITPPYTTPIARYHYEPALGGTTLGKTADQDTVTFTYSPRGALETATSTICSTPQSSTMITNSYDAVGRLLQETFSQHDGTTTYGYTTAGKPKSYTDVTGKTWAVTENDDYGRPTMVADEDVQLALNYDALGRLHTWTSTDKATNATLTTAVTWDALDREQNRQVTNSANNTAWKLEQEYYLNHQLSSKTMKRETGSTLNTVRTETYSYDERNRLTDYTCTGSDPVRDDKGNAIAQQSFAYDTYNNITKAVTEFSSGEPDTAIFTYGNAQDPCQLTSVSHSHNDFPAETYTYDAAGCLNADASGRQFIYDTGINCGYLRSVTQEDVTSNFVYDPLNRVIGEDDTSLVYCGSTLVNQRQGNDAVRFVGGGSVGTLAQVRSGDNAGVWLSGSEANGSVLSVDNASASTKHYDIAYGPYGETPSNQSTPSALGYNGQRKSNLLDGYQLGNGYRLYQPSLCRFTAPDSESPFGAGGINSYAYCAGDPINNTDPTGHHVGWMPIVGEIGALAGLAAAVFTGGSSLAITAAGLGVTAGATGIASQATASSNPTASKVLGYISLGTGLASAAIGLGSPAVSSVKRIVRSSSKGLRRGFGELITRAEFGVDGNVSDASEDLNVETGWNQVKTTKDVVQKFFSNEDYYNNLMNDGFRVSFNENGGRIYTTRYSSKVTSYTNVLARELEKNGKVYVYSGQHGTPNFIFDTQPFFDEKIISEDDRFLSSVRNYMESVGKHADVELVHLRTSLTNIDALIETIKTTEDALIFTQCYSNNFKPFRIALNKRMLATAYVYRREQPESSITTLIQKLFGIAR